MVTNTEIIVANEPPVSAVAWGAVIAGSVTAVAITVVLGALGAAIGFSSVSPWPALGISAKTFALASGFYLLICAILASSIGGYLAGRLRTRWAGVHHDEVYFRDTAHGLISWALATAIGASAFAMHGTYIAGALTSGAAQGVTVAASRSNGGIESAYVDTLLRPSTVTVPVAGDNGIATRAEVGKIFGSSVVMGNDLVPSDRAYVAQVVAARTGLSQSEAEARVDQASNDMKAAADKARKTAAHMSWWLTAALLIGALSAAFAAIEGGRLRDRQY